mgnify:CR=1 FL=1
MFLSILKNSADAMQRRLKSEENYQAKLQLKVYPSRDGVITEIRDNGIGISHKYQHRIFEPFFSTKSVGSGIGLSLSTAYFIGSEQHRGKLWFESSPQRGSTFFIELPRERKNHSQP